MHHANAQNIIDVPFQ